MRSDRRGGVHTQPGRHHAGDSADAVEKLDGIARNRVYTGGEARQVLRHMEGRLERPVMVCPVNDYTRRHAGRSEGRPRSLAQTMPGQRGVRPGIRMRLPGQLREHARPIAY